MSPKIWCSSMPTFLRKSVCDYAPSKTGRETAKSSVTQPCIAWLRWDLIRWCTMGPVRMTGAICNASRLPPSKFISFTLYHFTDISLFSATISILHNDHPRLRGQPGSLPVFGNQLSNLRCSLHRRSGSRAELYWYFVIQQFAVVTMTEAYNKHLAWAYIVLHCDITNFESFVRLGT